MIKRIKSNILMRYDEEEKCTPYLDCSAHDAAQAAVNVAKTNYNNAKALCKALRAEMDNVKSVVNDYKEIYGRVAECGPSVNSPAITGRLSGMIECACNYGSSVESSYNQSISELDRCTAELQKAQIKLANTPCVWECR